MRLETGFQGPVPCVVRKAPDGALLMVICDGRASWGDGLLAAAAAAPEIVERLSSTSPGATGPFDRIRAAIDATALSCARFHKPADFEPVFSAVVARIESGFIHAAHAGDCGVALVRARRLHFVTRPWRVVDQLVNEGKMEPDETGRHDLRPVLLSTVICSETSRGRLTDLDFSSMRLRAGDRILCGTSEVLGAMNDPALASEVGRDPAQVAAQALLRRTKGAGTAVVVACI